MGAVYLNATIVDAYITEELRVELTDDDETVLDRLMADASDVVTGILMNAGYPKLPDSTDPNTTEGVIVRAALGALLIELYERKDLPVDTKFARHLATLDGLRSGEFRPISISPSAQGAIGGGAMTDPNGNTSVNGLLENPLDGIDEGF